MLNKSRKRIIILVAGIITAIIMGALFFSQQFAPFGTNSLAWNDANIQYLDFYAYYKDVIAGDNSILYTFSKTLGGTNIAVFSYYLSSPFMLLALLFHKSQLNALFDLNVLLKLALAAMTFSYFLLQRLEKYITSRLKCFFVVALAVAYSLSQYSIAQASNNMWLDGVYMLPLMLLGVYRGFENKGGWKLSMVVGYSILVNWYLAGINCLFSGVWFVVEYLLQRSGKESFKERSIYFIKNGIRYCITMLVGVMLSAALFLPTIRALGNSTRGSLETDKLFGFDFYGKIPSTIQNFVYGATSSYGSVALFCGCLALIALVAYFVQKSENRYHKSVLGCLAVLGILMYYFVPLYTVFSLFKEVGSYWYRFSHIGIFIILFIAAQYLIVLEHEKNYILPLKSACGFSAVLLILDYIHPIWDYKETYLTAAVLIVVGGLVSLIFYTQKKQDKNRGGYYVLIACLAVVCVGDYAHNARLLMNTYYTSDTDQFEEYSREASEQIAAVKEYDDGTYRISQTSTRNMSEDGLTANYNEALAYNYWSLSGYTSSPDDIQRAFLEKLGYPRSGDNMCIVNTSILGADSLLGVKYVLSSYPIKGLEKVDSIAQYNGKDTYENPYCLPMAIVYNNSDITYNQTNPFEYQNSIYSKLAGEIEQIYEPVTYDMDTIEDKVIYTLHIPNGNYSIYGNIPWYASMDAALTVNDTYSKAYACWLSQSVFDIPAEGNEATIEIQSDKLYNMDSSNVQFYALNLDKLKQVVSRLKNDTPSYRVKNGHAEIYVENAEDKQSVYVSIPYDKGWTIKRNGEEIHADMIGDCMYSIPLVEGENTIEMGYHVQGLKSGIVVSILAVFLMVGLEVFKKKEIVIFRRRKKENGR